MADPARPAEAEGEGEAEAGCLCGLAGLGGEILKYKNVFQIICSVILVIIPANNLEALRHKSEMFDSFQFKLYL